MTAATVTPIPDDLFTALGNFIVLVLGISAALVDRGIDNLVPMPPGSPGFVVMTGLFQIPQSTNTDAWDTTNPAPTQMTAQRNTRFDVQLDCYGPTSDAWASMLTTLLRDDYGCVQLAPTCQPMFCEDAKMLPLDNAEAQYEQRWTFTVALDYSPVVTVPQQFAAVVGPVVLKDVDVVFPAA